MKNPRKILAVDNQPSVIRSLGYIFAGPRYDLTCVDHGEAALAKLDSGAGPYEVIIVDQKMPNLTGLELVEAIRKRGLTTKIIVVSAHLSAEIREAYKRLDVQAMFGKPFDIEQIRAAIDGQTDEKSVAESSSP